MAKHTQTFIGACNPMLRQALAGAERTRKEKGLNKIIDDYFEGSNRQFLHKYIKHFLHTNNWTITNQDFNKLCEELGWKKAATIKIILEFEKILDLICVLKRKKNSVDKPFLL